MGRSQHFGIFGQLSLWAEDSELETDRERGAKGRETVPGAQEQWPEGWHPRQEFGL